VRRYKPVTTAALHRPHAIANIVDIPDQGDARCAETITY
jgi:hypothetical protein